VPELLLQFWRHTNKWWILPSIPKQLPVTKSEIVGDDRLIKSAGANRCTLANLRLGSGASRSLSMRVRLKIDAPTPLGGELVWYCLCSFFLIQGIGGSAFKMVTVELLLLVETVVAPQIAISSACVPAPPLSLGSSSNHISAADRGETVGNEKRRCVAKCRRWIKHTCRYYSPTR